MFGSYASSAYVQLIAQATTESNQRYAGSDTNGLRTNVDYVRD
jgi:hypothetical protein